MPGPPPKRSTQRRRRNKSDQPIQKATAAKKVPVPKPDAKWHPIAKRWYLALAKSGQAQFYEPSDWATAFVLAESMSRDLGMKVVGTTKDGDLIQAIAPINGTSLNAYLKAMTALLVTEGDRRRARLELERGSDAKDDGNGNVSWIDEARRRRRSAG